MENLKQIFADAGDRTHDHWGGVVLVDFSIRIKQKCFKTNAFLPCSAIFRKVNSIFPENIGFCGPFCTGFIWGHLGAFEIVFAS